MLSETKQNVQDLVNKVQVLDFALQSLNLNHADYKDRIEVLYKTASNYKLVLIDELLRLNGAERVEVNPKPIIVEPA